MNKLLVAVAAGSTFRTLKFRGPARLQLWSARVALAANQV